MDKEAARLRKQREKVEKDVASHTARISNPSFVDRAPAAVVAEVHDKLSEAQRKLAALDEKLAQMLQVAGSQ